MEVPAPTSIAPIAPARGALELNSNRIIYEELGGNSIEQFLEVENVAYHTRGIHRRCAASCDGDSAWVEDGN